VRVANFANCGIIIGRAWCTNDNPSNADEG
jgi:hypothetical protein